MAAVSGGSASLSFAGRVWNGDSVGGSSDLVKSGTESNTRRRCTPAEPTRRAVREEVGGGATVGTGAVAGESDHSERRSSAWRAAVDGRAGVEVGDTDPLTAAAEGSGDVAADERKSVREAGERSDTSTAVAEAVDELVIGGAGAEGGCQYRWNVRRNMGEEASEHVSTVGRRWNEVGVVRSVRLMASGRCSSVWWHGGDEDM